MRRYNQSYPRRAAVPLEVAQRILNERDALEVEVRRLRDENAVLKGEIEQLREPAPEPVAAPEAPEPVVADPSPAFEAQITALMDDLTRLRERTRSEIELARRDERSRLITGLGDVLDSVQRGLSMHGGDDDSWQVGLRAIESQLLAYFRDQGVTLTGAVGQVYDPSVHEAVAMTEGSTVPRGRITRVDRPGLLLDDGTVARSARVSVAA